MTSTDNTQEPDVEEILEKYVDIADERAEAKQAINQLILKVRIKELEYVLDSVYWPIEGDRQHILERIAQLNSKLEKGE